MRETDKQLNKKEHCSHMCLPLRLSFLLSATWCGSHKPQPRLQVESIPEPRLIIGLRGFCAGLITKRVTRAWIIQGYLRYVCPSLSLPLCPSSSLLVHLSVHFYCQLHSCASTSCSCSFSSFIILLKVSVSTSRRAATQTSSTPRLAGNTICGLGLGSRSWSYD